MLMYPKIRPVKLTKVESARRGPTASFKDSWDKWDFSTDEGYRLFDEVRARLSVYQVYEHFGGSLYRGFVPQPGYCIVHQDTKRSAKISEDHFVCYAGCGHGDVLWLLRRLLGGRSLQVVVKFADETFKLGLVEDPEVAKAVFTPDARPKVHAPRLDSQLDTMKIHRVYQGLLGFLPLLKRHRAELADKRKLSEKVVDALDQKGYRSWKEDWEHKYVNFLIGEMGVETFHGIPGFYQENSQWRFYAPDGILFPVLDMNGTIRALSLRKDIEGNGKYVYVSSNHRPSGTRSWYGLHVIRNGASFKNIWVVEGILKADVVSQFLPEAGLIIGIPSMTVGHKDLTDIFADFPKSNVVLAIDADWREKSTVREGLAELVKKIQTKVPEQKLSLACWDPKLGKGLDDVLANGQRAGVSINALD